MSTYIVYEDAEEICHQLDGMDKPRGMGDDEWATLVIHLTALLGIAFKARERQDGEGERRALDEFADIWDEIELWEEEQCGRT